jgi:hypothetical protein
MICSSKREYITIAEMPASSNFKALSIFFEKGEAEAASGFLRFKPR